MCVSIEIFVNGKDKTLMNCSLDSNIMVETMETIWKSDEDCSTMAFIVLFNIV